MIKHYSFLIIAVFFLSAISIDAQSIWKKASVTEFRDAPAEEKMVLPEHYIAYSLSFETLKTKLANVPTEEDKRSGMEGILIDLPMPDGSFETFEVYDSPVFAPKLAAKYPSIKSYKGISVDNPGKNVRFDTGPYGFHAAIHGQSDIIYIDPYSKNSSVEYITYNVEDHLSQLEFSVPLCGTQDDEKALKENIKLGSRSSVPIALHVYRFALACTGEWGAIRGTVEKALADMNTGVNRINQIYENELAIRLVLIDDNDKLLNFNSQTDPYGIIINNNDHPNPVMDEENVLKVNTNIVNFRIGNKNYDIGHLYHTRCNVGGIASLGSMCNNFLKANGLTCHYNNSLNFMAATVTSHEIGHQMTAQHTFNNCNGNEEGSNAFEPGSGSTIMAYGGLCGASLNVVDNGQGGNYYHGASLIQIYNHTRGDGLAGDGCAEQIETSNIEPTANILHEDGFYIPEDTYFYLEGEGLDDNEEDQLTYTWEQMNRGPTSPLGSPNGDAPHFRSLPPNPSPIRYFPSPDNILSGISDRTEVAFKGDRTVDFIFTVRDNNAEAGTAVWKELQFKVAETPEKFGITSQSNFETYTVGEEVDVNWNVAGTNFNPINAKKMDILLFTGNQTNFNISNTITLAKDVFNSGNCKVIIPDVVTSTGRLILKASDGNFFSINDKNITIQDNSDPLLLVNSDPLAQTSCEPSSFSYEISSDNINGVDGDITYMILDGLPPEATATFEPETVEIGASSTLKIDGTINDPVGMEYAIRVGAVTESMDTFSRVIYISLKSTVHSEINAITPEVDLAGQSIVPPVFNWTPSPNADFYTFELSKSPSFGSTNIIEVARLTDNTYLPELFFEKNTVYYWRITAENDCGYDNNQKIFAFSTESLFCIEATPAEDVLPINISGSGKPTIQAPVEVSLTGNIADVNVKYFFGQHSNNKDMTVSLISPEGKAVILVSDKCQQQNFNCGFDDESDIDVKCPLNNGNVYKPQESLSAFNGDPIEGTWIFQIEDTKSGNGGKLEGLEIEFCSSQVLDNPFIVRNEKISIGWGGSPIISQDKLKVEDANNSNDELVYTLVELPAKGQLTFNGGGLNVGDQFSQKDIDDEKLMYTALNEDYETQFSFTIIDGEGGFIGITNFDIEVSESTSVEDDLLIEEILVYPNPARDQITIDATKSSLKFNTYTIMNIHGQTVMAGSFNNRESLNVDINLLTSGFYIINLNSENKTVPKKIIVE